MTMSVVVSAGVFLFVLVSSLLAFFPLPVSVVDDVGCVPITVDVVASVFASVLISSFLTGPGPTASRVASSVSPNARGRGLLVLLDGSRCYHRLDPGCDRGSRVVLVEHGDDRIHERPGGEEILLRCGEDVLTVQTHL